MSRPTDLSRASDERGVAMIAVLLASTVIGLFATWMLDQAWTEYDQTQAQRWEDVTIAGTEAILDRYASKLTIDPAYNLHWVDEAERARVCQSVDPTLDDQVVEPGNAWLEGCSDWTYQDPATDWFHHPLLDGASAGPEDDVEARIEVTPPAANLGLVVTVAARQTGRPSDRIVSAEINATALSEFFRVTEEDLNYGAGAEIWGKVYSGEDLDFDNGPPQGRTHRDAYAEGRITSPPVFLDGAKGWDGTSTTPQYDSIRKIFKQPLNFDNFWDDLDVLRSAACNGGGVCLNQSGTTAWRIQPFVSGGVGKLRVWRSTTSPSSTSCLTSEEWWWLNAQSASWTLHTTASSPSGVYDVPRNGALWANAHVVLGDPASAASTLLKGALSIYAGSSSSRRNVIINSDVAYNNNNGFDTLGLIASDEVILNPNAVGVDRVMNVRASLLAQADGWRVGRTCGADGSFATPSSSTLNVTGSIATRTTGDIAGHFPVRNYGFDNRLEYLRPPFFPLLEDGWSYENWQELPRPDWAQ